MTEPPLHESYMRYKALEAKYGYQPLQDTINDVMYRDGFDFMFTREEPNSLQYVLTKKLSEVINYSNEFQFAEQFLSNIFAFQKREKIEVEDFLPFVAAAIKSKATPRVVWHDTLLFSKDKLAGNPICIDKFLESFHKLVPDDNSSGVVDWLSAEVQMFLAFSDKNNREMHRFAYAIFKIRK